MAGGARGQGRGARSATIHRDGANRTNRSAPAPGKSSTAYRRYASSAVASREAREVGRARPAVDASGVPGIGDAFGDVDDLFAAAIRPDLVDETRAAAPVQRQRAFESTASYLGAYESLGRDGVAMADDAAIQAGMLGARRELATLAPTSAEYRDRRHNLTALQWEAERRGIGEQGALPATHGRVGPGGVVLFDEPVHCRRVLEQQIAAGGMERARAFMRSFRAMVGDGPRPAGPSEISAYDGAISLALEQQLEALELENAEFEDEFERRALTTARQILDESERRVRAEMARYGMSVDRTWGFAGASAYRDGETDAMRLAARSLLDSMRGVKALHRQRSAMMVQAGRSAPGDTLDNDRDADVDGMGGDGVVTPDEIAALAALDRQLDAARFEHARLRTAVEAEHPALARYTSEAQLERVSQEQFGPKQVAWDLDGNLVNIEKTRGALGDDLSVFRLPQVVDIAKRQMMVRPGSMRDRLIAERVDGAQRGVFETVAIAVLSIGLGLLAVVPTGGASLAASATVAAATTAGAALDAYLVYDSIHQYQFDRAATGTDPDKARALARGEPSLFWLAVEIVGAGIGAAATAKVFRGLARARRAALEAARVDDIAGALDELERLTETAGLPGHVGERLTHQVASEHPTPDVATRARSAGKECIGARGASSGRDFDPAMAGGPIRTLSTSAIQITERGIAIVENHVARFGPDPANQHMIARLRQIARGSLEPTDYDLNFYSHELREYVRYRRLGHPVGSGDDWELWNNTHTASLEDYGLHEIQPDGGRALYHPDALREEQ